MNAYKHTIRVSILVKILIQQRVHVLYSPGSLQDRDTLIEQSGTERAVVKCINNQ